MLNIILNSEKTCFLIFQAFSVSYFNILLLYIYDNEVKLILETVKKIELDLT